LHLHCFLLKRAWRVLQSKMASSGVRATGAANTLRVPHFDPSGAGVLFFSAFPDDLLGIPSTATSFLFCLLSR